MKLFTEKYAPRKPSDIIGQEEALSKLHDFVGNYSSKKQKKRAVLLHGPTGTGKTGAAYVIGKQFNLEIVEVNASDFRNAENINSLLGSAIRQQSLFSTGKLILVDEIDGLAGNPDRGGVQALVKLIEETTFPVVLTAINPYDNKLSSLRSKCLMLAFKALEPESIASILHHICAKEVIPHDEDSLKLIARRAGGDARAAITNLEVLTILNEKITKKSVEELGDRDRTETIITALQKIFKTSSARIALSAFETVDEDINEQMLWIDENMPKEYTKTADLARAYDVISKADIFNRRIRRWQHYRFLVYVNALLSGGVAVAKDEKNPNFVEYKPTGRILKLWWANQKSMKKKAIAEKLAHKTHTSKRSALQSTLPYFTILFNAKKEMQPKLIEEFDLNDEEVEWLMKNAHSFPATS